MSFPQFMVQFPEGLPTPGREIRGLTARGLHRVVEVRRGRAVLETIDEPAPLHGEGWCCDEDSRERTNKGDCDYCGAFGPVTSLEEVDDEVEEIKALVREAETSALQSKLQTLHQMKLGPACLFNPSNRDKVDQLVAIIAAELRLRREESA